MAKLKEDPAVQALLEKAVAAALKTERARVKKALAGPWLPEGTTARAGAAIKQAVKEAIAADD